MTFFDLFKKIKMAIFGPLVLTGGTTLPEIRKMAISFNWGVVEASKPDQSIEEIKVSFNFLAEGRSPFRAHWLRGKTFAATGALAQPNQGLCPWTPPGAAPLDPLMLFIISLKAFHQCGSYESGFTSLALLVREI